MYYHKLLDLINKIVAYRTCNSKVCLANCIGQYIYFLAHWAKNQGYSGNIVLMGTNTVL